MKGALALVLVVVLGACSQTGRANLPGESTSPPQSPPSSTVQPTILTSAPAAARKWTLVAQFKGGSTYDVPELAFRTHAFTTSQASRLTWLADRHLAIVVYRNTRADQPLHEVGRVDASWSGPAFRRIGNISIQESGGFFLAVNSTGYYQVDIEEFR